MWGHGRFGGLMETERRRWGQRGAVEGRGVEESEGLRLGGESGSHGCHFQ